MPYFGDIILRKVLNLLAWTTSQVQAEVQEGKTQYIVFWNV